jgi:cystathionine beta-synthase
MRVGEEDQGLCYYRNIVETIGRTPLVRLNKVSRGLKPLILAKVESFNPGGSVKDRIGHAMIDAAEHEGKLKPGGTIIESTSGNTGLGLAMVAAIRGYKCICCIPDKMSQEKINLLKAYGADVHVAPTAVPPDHPDSYYEMAKRLAREIPGAFHANQYYNPENPHAHYLTTGPEIWEQTGGQVDVFVGGIGTGGTISGVGKFLKEKNPAVRIVAADPAGSILCEYFCTKKIGHARTYKTEGVGEDIIPGTVDFSGIDRIITTSDHEAYNWARRVSREEGILIGSSGGAAIAAALTVARGLDERQVIVVLLPDTGERYLSKVHSDEWMRDNRLLDTHFVKVGEVLDRKSNEVPPLVLVGESDSVRRALELIREYNVSQLPVTRGEEIVGAVEEGTIMSTVLEDAHVLESPVREMMREPLTRVSASDSVDHVITLLADRNAVIVDEGGTPRGILTRYDLIEYVAI